MSAGNAATVQAFRDAGGSGPRYAELTLCWAEDEAAARRTAHRRWPNAALPGQLSQELALPAHFEQAAQAVTEDDVAQVIVCGPDVERHLAKIREYVDAGIDRIFLHQVGPDQEGFMRFFEQELQPRLPAVAPEA